jgi:dolichol-phosphate mannosyltransferase
MLRFDSNSKLTVVVPTYREAENLPELIRRVFAAASQIDMATEMVVVDDDSRDGTEQICSEMQELYAVKLITRKGERGLATAVQCGIESATSEWIIVMDADLSHPPEVIPNLVRKLREGADFVLGSRYVKGGSTDAQWSLYRWLNSRIAILLAKGLTNVKDPTSGYFAFPKRILKSAPPLSPVGYKIGLEILAKARCQKVVEIPIAFVDRQRGTSKLNLKEQLLYLRHLGRLYCFRLRAAQHRNIFGNMINEEKPTITRKSR